MATVQISAATGVEERQGEYGAERRLSGQGRGERRANPSQTRLVCL